MAISSPPSSIEDVKASIDATLETANADLRELNRQVRQFPIFISFLLPSLT